LQAGSLGLVGLSLPDLLRADAATGREKSCVFIVQYGGASHVDSLDPKPDAPHGVRGPYKALPPALPGSRVGAQPPRRPSPAPPPPPPPPPAARAAAAPARRPASANATARARWARPSWWPAASSRPASAASASPPGPAPRPARNSATSRPGTCTATAPAS